MITEMLTVYGTLILLVALLFYKLKLAHDFSKGGLKSALSRIFAFLVVLWLLMVPAHRIFDWAFVTEQKNFGNSVAIQSFMEVLRDTGAILEDGINVSGEVDNILDISNEKIEEYKANANVPTTGEYRVNEGNGEPLVDIKPTTAPTTGNTSSNSSSNSGNGEPIVTFHPTRVPAYVQPTRAPVVPTTSNLNNYQVQGLQALPTAIPTPTSLLNPQQIQGLQALPTAIPTPISSLNSQQVQGLEYLNDTPSGQDYINKFLCENNGTNCDGGGPSAEVGVTEDGRIFYTVKRGDSLAKISQKFYGTKNRAIELCRHNGIRNCNNISVGMKIYFP